MSSTLLAKAWAWSRSRGSARLVLVALADAADDFGEYSGELKLIGQRTALPKAEVMAALSDLSALGEVAQRLNRWAVTLKRPTPAPTEPPPKIEKIDSAEFIQAWNALPVCFPKIANWTPARMKSLKARMSEEFWVNNWRQALAVMAASPFHRGENDRKWVGDVDYFLRPDTVTKLMERKTETTTPNGTAKKMRSAEEIYT